MKEFLTAANPYMPLWEYVPDGEPHIFWYKGEKRVFVYGSHDTNIERFCGTDYVAWSAPLDDLTNWTYHGVIYQTADGSDLWAPDVCEKNGKYYLYSAEDWGKKIYVSKSDSPAGPFTDPELTELGFDPGILVDDDGKVYAFWGSYEAYIAELEDDMKTIKPGTKKRAEGSCFYSYGEDPVNGFFEASSPRKIMGKYVYIFSKRTHTPHPEIGLQDPEEGNNSFISYAYSDNVYGPYIFGGDISFNRGETVTGRDGLLHTSYCDTNNHGSLAKVNGQWYIFYHKFNDETPYSRQAMLEPCDIALGKDGKLYIGDITYLDGEPVSAKPVEMTSQGPYINGIDARLIISAGFTCHLYGGSKQARTRRTTETGDRVSALVGEITDGTSVGFKYLQFGTKTPESVTVKLDALTDCDITVRVGHYRGKEIAKIHAEKGPSILTAPLTAPVIGKEAVYFIFNGEDGKDLAMFDWFTFDN